MLLDLKVKERLEEIEEEKGELFITNYVFWELLEQLPIKYQKEALKLAEHALKHY
jgi:hypothetical protein